jgi:hypothetical protein
MGLLDDAIREHLELKRRRGADPDEIARQEGEALGDPRSGEFAREDAELEEGLAPEPSLTEEEPSDEDEPEDLRVLDDEDAWFADEEEEDRLETGGRASAPPDEEDEDVVRPDDEPARDEDVLEETPDFLQETPEHDRLWFEQKPPRDFDFDG